MRDRQTERTVIQRQRERERQRGRERQIEAERMSLEKGETDKGTEKLKIN